MCGNIINKYYRNTALARIIDQLIWTSIDVLLTKHKHKRLTIQMILRNITKSSFVYSQHLTETRILCVGVLYPVSFMSMSIECCIPCALAHIYCQCEYNTKTHVTYQRVDYLNGFCIFLHYISSLINSLTILCVLYITSE